MRFMGVMIAYLYEPLDINIYMKVHERFKMPKACKSKHHNLYSIKLQRYLYGLK